jgi:predicted lipoprotein with Yx(FWY)xxD motif
VTRLTAVLLTATALAVAGLVAVLLSRSPGAEVRDHTARHAEANSLVDVRVAHSRLGRILVDGQGRTLYLFVLDHRGRSACSGSCARVWPPLIVSGVPRAGAGLDPAKLSTTRRGDHPRQLVYNGHPLYRMSADVRPGQIAGEGFSGQWYVVSPAGRSVGRRTHSGAGGY